MTEEGFAPTSSPSPGASPPPAADGVKQLTTHLQTVLQKARTRNWIATLRPARSFFAGFSRPRNVAEASTRLEVNLAHFATNYLLCVAVLFTMVILSRPLLLIVAVALGGAWLYVLSSDGDEEAGDGREIRLGKFVLEGRNKILALAALSVVIVFLTAGSVLFMSIGLSATLVLVHASMHGMPVDEELDEAAITAMEMQSQV